MGQYFSKVMKNRLKRFLQSSKEDETTLPPTTDMLGDPVPTDSLLVDGRVFKKSGSPIYPLPNDRSEYARLNAQHYLCRYIHQSNYLSPVTEGLKHGIKVLDAGCGTGVWSKELAEAFPNSTFIGTDITNTFAGFVTNAPPNLSFIEIDTLKGLPFEDNTIDFVFQRMHLVCFTEEMWPVALKELVRVTKPGGWIEISEVTWPVGGPALTKHAKWTKTFLKFRGITDEIVPRLGTILTSLGLEVKTLNYPMALGLTPDDTELRKKVADNMLGVMKGMRSTLCTALGIGDEEFEEVFSEIENEFENNIGEPFLSGWTHYGQKPVSREE